MLLKDMNAELRGLLQVFNDELGQAGWEVEDFGEMLLAGIFVSPEGIATLENENVSLEVHLDLSEHELRLFILDRATDQLIRLVIAFNADLRGVLAYLIREQDRLDRTTFPQLLLQTSGLVDRIWFVDHEGTRFLLEFPTAS